MEEEANYLRKKFLCDAMVLSFFSFAGALTRVGFSNLFTVTHGLSNIAGAVNTDFYSNVIGSLIMGLLVPFKKFFEEETRWWGTTLYIGLTTGYCGSLTTFSSLSNQASTTVFAGSGTNFVLMILIGFSVPYWALQIAMHLSDNIASRIATKQRMRSEHSMELPVISSLPLQGISPPMSVSSEPPSLLLNKKNSPALNNVDTPEKSQHISQLLEPVDSPATSSAMKVSDHLVPIETAAPTNTIPSPSSDSVINSPVNPRSVEEDEAPLPTQVDPHPGPAPEVKRPLHIPLHIVTLLCLSIALIYIALIILSALSKGAQYYTLICIFAPIGTLIRWSLGRRNIYHPKFPLYTFWVNFFGSAILGSLHVISERTELSSSSSNVIAGLITGFCGCLTTVSSFVNEVYHLHLWNSYAYTLVSIFATQAVLVLINGLNKV